MQDLTITFGSERLNMRAGALIVKDGRLLLVWSVAGDHWCTPGGRIQFGESSEEAVMRELYEEMGEHAALLKDGKLVAIEENFVYLEHMTMHEYGFYYYFDGSDLPEEKELVLGDCSGKFKFLTREELATERLYPTFLKKEIPHDGIRHFVRRGD